ncbi:MAG: scpA [Clostridia bacterium]|nr:scpA [Clostridia bacterium]
MNKLSFKLEMFEGPLDLLMHLIEKNKVSIYDIPIAEITDQYLEYLNHMSGIDLEVSSEFLVLAAQLLYIKSKMLLPQYKDTEEEGGDPRQELIEKLVEYKRYKELSVFLEERENKYKNIFFKNADEIEISEENYNLIHLSVNDLVAAFNKILLRNNRINPPSQKTFEKIVGREKVSVSAKVKEILNLLSKKKEIRFLDIFKNLRSRAEIVASFLAVLELIKLNKIIAEQRKIGENTCIYIYHSNKER